MTVKAETLNYQKNEARKNREIAQGCTKSVNLVQIFFNNHLSPNFKNLQEMLDYTPEVHRMSGKDRARESARNWFLQSSNKTDGKAAETILLKPF